MCECKKGEKMDSAMRQGNDSLSWGKVRIRRKQSSCGRAEKVAANQREAMSDIGLSGNA